MPAHTATFANLPQAAGQTRSFAIYVQSSAAPASGSCTLAENGTASPTLVFSGSASTPLGSGWYEVGTVTLGTADNSSALTVNYSGSAVVTAATLLEQTSTMVYNAQEDLLSTTDALGDVTASTYDGLARPLTSLQGQSVPTSAGTATLANLPQAPNETRLYTIYVQSTFEPFGRELHVQRR